MRYRTTEFVLATDYKPKLGKLYFIGADGNLYETTMGPKSKGYKAPMVAELNIKREEGWLYSVKRNPEVEYFGDSKKAKVFKDSIRRAVYKASPLPSAPDEVVFDKELIFIFSQDIFIAKKRRVVCSRQLV